MKTKKIKLSQIQVTSFITSQEASGIMGASKACLPTQDVCITPSPGFRSQDYDCEFTRINQNCILAIGD